MTMKWKRSTSTMLLLVVGVLYICPIIWMVLGSLKTQRDIFSYIPKVVFTPTLANYAYIMNPAVALYQYLENSLVVALASSIIALALGTWTAFALANFRVVRQRDFEFWILSMRMIPPLSVIVPFYLMFTQLHLFDTRSGLVLVYLTFNIPLVVWLLKGFFADVPKEIGEAARVDGCGVMGLFVRIALPLVRPGLVAAFLLCVMTSWNEFPFALYLTSRSAVTIPVAINGFNTQNGVQWGPLLAAGTIAVVPVFILSVAIRRHLVRGLTMGSAK